MFKNRFPIELGLNPLFFRHPNMINYTYPYKSPFVVGQSIQSGRIPWYQSYILISSLHHHVVFFSWWPPPHCITKICFASQKKRWKSWENSLETSIHDGFSHIFAYFPCLLVEKTVIFDTAQQPWRPCSSACWISLRRRWTFGMFRSQQVAGWCFFVLVLKPTQALIVMIFNWLSHI